MATEVYYEVEGAVFRERDGQMEVFSDRLGDFKPYTGDIHRVHSQSNPMSLEEAKPFMGSSVGRQDRRAS